MSQFVLPYKVRWGDLDPNRHLANSGFVDLFTDTRMQFLKKEGVDQNLLAREQVGPVIFNESIHYFREVGGGEKVYVDIQCNGISENNTFFEFHQHLYNSNGEICGFIEILAAWFNLSTRRLASPPEIIAQAIRKIPQTEGFRVLKKEDTRKVSASILQKRLHIEFLDQ